MERRALVSRKLQGRHEARKRRLSISLGRPLRRNVYQRATKRLCRWNRITLLGFGKGTFSHDLTYFRCRVNFDFKAVRTKESGLLESTTYVMRSPCFRSVHHDVLSISFFFATGPRQISLGSRNDV